MAVRGVDTQATARFATLGSGPSTDLSLDFGTIADIPNPLSVLTRSVRVAPNDPAIIMRVSRGSIQYIDTIAEEQSEYVLFNGSQEANTSFPIDPNSFAKNVQFAFELDGDPMTPLPTIQFTPNTTILTANKPFIGAVRCSYMTTFRIYEYIPSVTVNPINQGTSVENGTILAVRDTTFATLEVPLSELIISDAQPAKKELYRVYSVVQTTAGGAYEKHPDFDLGTGKWDQNLDENVPDPEDDSQARSDFNRVHEIGYVNENSRFIDYDFVDVRLQQKPGDNGTFLPRLFADFRGPSEFNSTPEWAARYESLDITAAKFAINQRFPGHSVSFIGEG